MFCREGKVSLTSFIFSLTTQLFGVSEFGEKLALLLNESIFTQIYALLLLYFVVTVIVLSIGFHKSKDFQIAGRAGILGYLFGVSLFVAITFEEEYKSFGIYGAFLTFFHYSEYLVISISNPQSLSLDSFMLTHSVQYGIAALLSWTEYFAEAHFYPEMKKYKSFWIIGSSICILGEVVRKLAILTARKSFHHIVQFQQADDHKLVTDGVYSFCRHPSYVGWFYWSFATQIILANPICLVFYIIASWLFFKQRIYMEEIYLINFFGDEYLRYRQSVSTGLPFIKGYSIDN